MRGIEVQPFGDEHLDPAAALLAERHRRHRAAEPLLPDAVDFREQVEGEWRRDGASGAVAIGRGRLLAYLLGHPVDYGDAGLTWQLVEPAGHAVDGEREVLRDVFGAAASRWHDEGQTRFGAFVPAADRDLVETWFRLCFGASGALAIREVAPEGPLDGGVAIRPGTADDLDAAARLDRAMRDSMQPSPSFSMMTTPSDEEFVDDWRGTWDDESMKHFVAERDGRIVGHILMYRRPSGDLRTPERNIDLANASTEPDARGTGVGRALTAHVLAWAHEQGYRTMTTDWRMTNLWASRFWPRRGFRTTYLRLYRSIP